MRSPLDGDLEVLQTWDDPRTREVYRGVGLAGHNGVDLAGEYGAIVRATAPGVVMSAGDGELDPVMGASAGTCVRIAHSPAGVPPYQSGYAHGVAGSVWVRPGQYVEEGAPLMALGDTGATTGHHLHYEHIADPVDIRDEWGGRIDPSSSLGIIG